MVSNSFDSDPPRRFVEPELGQNCLQKLQQTTLVGKDISIEKDVLHEPYRDKFTVRVIPLIIYIVAMSIVRIL